MMDWITHFLFGFSPTGRTHGHTPGGGMSYHWAMATPNPWIFVGGMAMLAALGWWSYRAQSAGPRLKRTMATLRAMVLALVVLLLGRPMLVASKSVRTPGTVAIWVDHSLSMTLRDTYQNPAMLKLIHLLQQPVAANAKGDLHIVPLQARGRRPSRYAIASHLLMQADAGWLGRLANRQTIAIYTGSSRARLLGQATSRRQLAALLLKLAARKPTGNATDVPRVVRGILEDQRGRPVSAVLLLTDGRSTPGSPPGPVARLARQRAVPVFTIPIGQKRTPFDLALQQVQAPRQAFVQDPVAVRGFVQVAGAHAGVVTTVRLLELPPENQPGKPRQLLSRRLHILPGMKRIAFNLVFHPAQPGNYRLAVKLDPVAGQITRRGNQAGPVDMRVVKAKIRVLYVDGYPRWEYRYLKNDLMREKTTQISCLLLSADNNFAQEGNLPINHFPDTQAQMDRYDVFLLGDVDPDYFSAAQDKIILRFVGRMGGGFGMIAGHQYAPFAYRNSPLARLLPIIPGNPADPRMVPPPNRPFELHLTAAGRLSPLFEFFARESENLRQVANLEPLYSFIPVAGLEPSAVVLANLPGYQIDGRAMPLVVMGRYGAGRTMFSAINDTWRWRYYHGGPLYKSYWLEMVRELARSRVFGGGRRLDLRSSSPRIDIGHSARVYLRVRGALAAQMPASVRLSVAGGTTAGNVLLSPVGAGNHLYEGLFTPWSVGTYTLSAAAGTLPGKVNDLRIRAIIPDLEFDNPRVDTTGLRQMALLTGGRLVRPPQLASLESLIPDRSLETVWRRNHQIWNKPIALILLIALLTVEWIVRKRAGLI